MGAGYARRLSEKPVTQRSKARSQDVAVLVVAVTLLICPATVGCGDDDDRRSPSGDQELLSYTRSGGIAGVSERLVIAADGSATLRIGFGDPDERRFELDSAQLERLRDLLAAADFAGVGPDRGIGCADCFQYEIAYAGKTTAFAEIDDIPESVGVVVLELGRIVEAEAPAAPIPG
jgi:hypothetical protein